MRILDLINERVSSVLYHAIDFGGAEQMLKTNRLKQKDVSFTRSLSGRYHLDNKIIGVIFEFDGDALNNNFKGGPIGTEDWYDTETDDPVYKGKENGQQEDRLNTENGLDNVLKYIKSAIMFCPIEFVQASYEDEFKVSYQSSVMAIYDVVDFLQKNNIPTRYVGSVKDLNNKNSNDPDKFLEAVAHVDEDAAAEMGYDKSRSLKQFNVEIVISKRRHISSNHVSTNDDDYDYFLKKGTLTASSMDEAEEKAAAALERFNDTHSESLVFARIKNIYEVS